MIRRPPGSTRTDTLVPYTTLFRSIRIENVYIPAGGETPDLEANPKFRQKLAFLERMTRWSEKLRQPTVLLGDFNIAPLECDVWNHKALLDVVSHTPVEVDLLTALRQSHDWIDLGRQLDRKSTRLNSSH